MHQRNKVVLMVEGPLPVDGQKLLNELKARLNRYTSPREITTMERFIETPSGKTDRIKTMAQVI